MEININQKKISIGDKYQVFIDGQQVYKASAKLFRWLSEVILTDTKSDLPKITIKKNWSFFKTSYDIYRGEHTVLAFRTISFWKRHYQCTVGNDVYDVYGHRGRKYSVYKNDEQVAWWTKKAVTWFAGDNYTITADNGSDYELLVAFCLVIDNAKSNANNKGTLTIDPGHIGPQAKKFDATWQPKW